MSEFIINDERVYYKRNYKEINDKKMEITSAEFVISNTDVKKCPAGIFPEYAFIGRSNVGKSSLINMLTARKGLAMTSATPGKTMLINHFLINKNWYLVDLPGYGYARRGQKGKDQIRTIIEDYILEREQMTNLFVTPKDIDEAVRRFSYTISEALNSLCHQI